MSSRVAPEKTTTSAGSPGRRTDTTVAGRPPPTANVPGGSARSKPLLDEFLVFVKDMADFGRHRDSTAQRPRSTRLFLTFGDDAGRTEVLARILP